MGLKNCFDAKGLGEYAEPFAGNEIESDRLPQVTENDLAKLAFSIGTKRRIALAFQFLNVAKVAPGLELFEEPDERGRRHLSVMLCDTVGFAKLASSLVTDNL